MTSASQLQRHCGYPRALAKIKPKSERATAAADKGTLFHSSVELWAKTGDLPSVVAGLLDDEVRGWLELLAMTWAPGKWMMLENAVGLSPDGGGVVVDEPQPHVYVARDGSPLLTAGRADVVEVYWHPGDPSRERGYGSNAGGDGRRVVRVMDWKTGRYPVASPAENLQLTALALAAAAIYDAQAFVRAIYYARDGYMDADPDPVVLDSDEGAAAWEMVERAAKLDDSARPGEWCQPCWERRLKRCDRAA
jgi:hypothetical protein